MKTSFLNCEPIAQLAELAAQDGVAGLAGIPGDRALGQTPGRLLG